jgi:hypothetical protein
MEEQFRNVVVAANYPSVVPITVKNRVILSDFREDRMWILEGFG